MALLLTDCFCMSLKSGCKAIAVYTVVVGALLLSFNLHDVIVDENILLGIRITGLIGSALLLVAGFGLWRGTVQYRSDLLALWVAIFLMYTVFSLLTVIWNIRWYYYSWFPNALRYSALANMIICSVLFFINILCLYAVESYRQHQGYESLP